MHVFGLCMTPYEAVMLDFMFIGSSRPINAVLNITVAQFTKNQRERLCSVCFDLISIDVLYFTIRICPYDPSTQISNEILRPLLSLYVML